MARYKRGPLAGIDYPSERQKRNAREYYLATGQVLAPAEAPTRARGLFGAAMRERERERPFFVAEEMGADVDTFFANHDYFLARWRQQNVGRIVPRSDAEFERVWQAVLRDRMRPGPAMDRLLAGAGMRTGLEGSNRARIHYMQYVRQEWDNLEGLGRTTTLERIRRQFGESA